MQEKAEFLSTLISARVDKCEKALERNWIAHIILAGIGLAFVFDLGGLPRALASRFFGPDHYNNLLPPMLMTPILLYSSTRLGQLLISFVRARRIQDELLTRILQDDPLGKYLEERSADLRPLFQTSSFFETYYSTTFDKGSVFSFLAITCGVVSTAQAAALFLIWKASDSLVSGYKSNRFNWLEIPSNFSWDSASSKARKMGTFSNSVTLRTCRIWCRLGSSCKRFLRIATST